MIQLDQLEQLIAFYEEGTITKAAERLLISQPSLTRSLQRLEEELDIPLFHRQKNKTTFTQTGLYAVQQAQVLLQQATQFLEKIHHQALLDTQIFIGTCAPGPIYELEDRAKEHQLSQTLNFALQPEDVLTASLLDETYQLVVTESPIEDDRVINHVLMKEQLLLSVPTKHILAERDELRLKDLEGLTMLLRTGLGTWDSLVASLTKTKFLTQTDDEMFDNLLLATDLPHFRTNVTDLFSEEDSTRIGVPIVDPEATKTFYIAALKKNRTTLSLFVEA